MTLQTMQPAAIDAEMAVLGSILLNSKILEDLVDKLKPDYFFDPKNKLLYSVMLDLWAKDRPTDIYFIKQEITKNPEKFKNLDSPIDDEFLSLLISKSSMITSPVAASQDIKEKFILRTVITVGDNLKNMAVEAKKTSNEILEDASSQLFAVAQDQIDKNFVSLPEILTETFERINKLYQNPDDYRGVPTGFHDLDKVLGGFHKSDLIIVAARPSVGKSSLCLEIAKRVALQSQTGVAIFSLEMSRDQLCDRMISSLSSIELRKIRSGKLSDDPANNEFMRLGMAIGQLDKAPIWIDDSGYLDLLDLRTKARRLKSKHNIGLIIIDYLQLMTSGSSNNRQGNRVQEVSEISRGLKILAKELDIPIIALSQLSRSVESRDDKRPMLSDLRDSGSIEQDADVVMFIHREEMYHKESTKKGRAEILISKHRNGETGTVELAFIHRLATFENLEGAKISHRVNA